MSAHVKKLKRETSGCNSIKFFRVISNIIKIRGTIYAKTKATTFESHESHHAGDGVNFGTMQGQQLWADLLHILFHEKRIEGLLI